MRLWLGSPKFGTDEPTHRGAVGDLYVADISVSRLVFERLGVRLASDVFDRGSVVRSPRPSAAMLGCRSMTDKPERPLRNA
jgi:hypothetical protein